MWKRIMKSSGSTANQLPPSAVAEEEGPRRKTASAISRRRRLISFGLLGGLVAIFALQMFSTRTFWETAWTRGTLFPGERPGESLTDLIRVQVGYPPRRGRTFDLSRLSVPRNEVLPGGPPKDGIPALTDPQLIHPAQANYLQPNDRVIGVVIGDETRAYPLKILNYHEIVNDAVGGQSLAVTYCPLCDSAAVFDRQTPLGEREFGVSGLLHNSNVLMYDRGGRPESLWSQVKTEGISGPAIEKSLESLPLELTTWADWKSRYPQTSVLSPETGHERDYSRNPYHGYFGQPTLMFPVQPRSDRLPAKERVLGVWTSSGSRAYPASAFSPESSRIEDQIGGKRVVIEFNPEARSLRVVEADQGVQWMYSLWFAWYAFHPDTDVFE